MTTRLEAKQRTRRRLLDAALHILDERGEAGLSTTTVALGAGIAQSSFYVHFSGMDELLCELIDELWQDQRAAGMAIVRAAPAGVTADTLRELLRARITGLVAHPAVLRLVLRSRLDPSTLIGEHTQAELETSRRQFAEHLAARGAPAATARDWRALEMQADGFIALVDTLALGFVDSRYRDIDEVLDVLLRFSVTFDCDRPPAGDRPTG